MGDLFFPFEFFEYRAVEMFDVFFAGACEFGVEVLQVLWEFAELVGEYL